jgi:hypothetical protein
MIKTIFKKQMSVYRLDLADSEQCKVASYLEHGEISAFFSRKPLLVKSLLVIKYLSNKR